MSQRSSCPERIELRCGPVSAVDLALFAAASGDHNPLHLDPEVARAAGFDRPLVHGMLTMAYTARLFTDHFGAGRVRAIRTRFTGVAMCGDAIVIRATLTGIDGSVATYDVQALTERGTDVAAGECRVSWLASGGIK